MRPTVAATLLLLLAGTASAQRDPIAAEALFREGRAAAQRGDWDGACKKFGQSQKLDPAVGTIVNIADCEEKRGRLASAWQRWREAAELLGDGDPRLALARRRAAALEPRVPRVHIVLSPSLPRARLRWDDVVLDAEALPDALPANPGPHLATLTVPGRAPRTEAVELREGERQELRLTPGAPVAVEPPLLAERPPPSRPVREPLDERAPARRGPTWAPGWVLLGVGAATLVGAGVAVAIEAGDAATVADHCRPADHLCDGTGLDAVSQGQTLSVVAPILWAFGGAATATSVLLLVLERGRTVERVNVAPLLAPHAAGLSIGGRF